MIGESGFQSQSLPHMSEPYTWHKGWLSQYYPCQEHNDGLELIDETFESPNFITQDTQAPKPYRSSFW